MFNLIREKINEWNPIGVSYLPDDEYDCLAEKIMNWVVDGATEENLVGLVDEDLINHFGLDDVSNVEEFISGLLDALHEKFPDEI